MDLLWEFAKEGEIEGISELINIGHISHDYTKLLRNILRKGCDRKVIEFFVHAGADLNSGSYISAFHLLLNFSEDVILVKLFLDHGADPNLESAEEMVPFHYCKSVEVAALLIEYGATKIQQDIFGNSCLDNIYSYTATRIRDTFVLEQYDAIYTFILCWTKVKPFPWLVVELIVPLMRSPVTAAQIVEEYHNNGEKYECSCNACQAEWAKHCARSAKVSGVGNC